MRAVHCSVGFDPAGAQTLDFGEALFGFQPAPFRARGRFCRAAQFRRQPGIEDEGGKARPRIRPVLNLGAKSLRHNHDFACNGGATARQFEQPFAHIGRQRRRGGSIKAQLHRSRYFVDVLTAGTGRAHELFIQFAFVDHDVRGYAHAAV